ncbi:unnamed protein product [Pseudo-nitzschia multistriata]|uniref:Uncharacterized protein n=1 Tax=Pseudo-nitzschia multistriata TaxID=183589 RepID=A0A448ZI85_9STRA|nr:unnamed protein product [Pseudo-nitzschia multistriata]
MNRLRPVLARGKKQHPRHSWLTGLVATYYSRPDHHEPYTGASSPSFSVVVLPVHWFNPSYRWTHCIRGRIPCRPPRAPRRTARGRSRPLRRRLPAA